MCPALRALVVPYDSGFRAERMGAGPERLIKAGVLDGLGQPAPISTFASQRSEFRGEIASALEIQRWLAGRVAECRASGEFPLVFAGNCMAAVGLYAGLRSRSRRVPGVCWFDAHGDFNTPETTESGFLDGMALAMLTGRCWKQAAKAIPDFRPATDAAVMMFGTRSLDAAERKALAASEINWPRAPRYGGGDSSAERLDALRGRVGEVYLHIDLDVLDESEGRANQFACAGGLTGARLVELVRLIGSSFHVGAAAITAYDPACDAEGKIPPIVQDVVEAISGALQ